MIRVSGAVGENERHRARTLEPMMDTKLVARMCNHQRRTLIDPRWRGILRDGLNCKHLAGRQTGQVNGRVYCLAELRRSMEVIPGRLGTVAG